MHRGTHVWSNGICATSSAARAATAMRSPVPTVEKCTQAAGRDSLLDRGADASVAARRDTLKQELGLPHLLQTGLDHEVPAHVFRAHSHLSAQDKAHCMAWASQVLLQHPDHLLRIKQHTQLSLEQLLPLPAGVQLVSMFASRVLGPLTAAGMCVPAWELVFSLNNTQAKPWYKGHYIRNKLGCQHQDLLNDEPWFSRPRYQQLPGCLRGVLDISPRGQRWFEFRLLQRTSQGLVLEEPMLEVHSDLVAFDRLAAGSGGFFADGSWIFHARRSHHPAELGVSIVFDLVVTAGLPGGGGGGGSEQYKQTVAYQTFHGYEATPIEVLKSSCVA